MDSAVHRGEGAPVWQCAMCGPADHMHATTPLRADIVVRSEASVSLYVAGVELGRGQQTMDVDAASLQVQQQRAIANT